MTLSPFVLVAAAPGLVVVGEVDHDRAAGEPWCGGAGGRPSPDRSAAPRYRIPRPRPTLITSAVGATWTWTRPATRTPGHLGGAVDTSMVLALASPAVYLEPGSLVRSWAWPTTVGTPCSRARMARWLRGHRSRPPVRPAGDHRGQPGSRWVTTSTALRRVLAPRCDGARVAAGPHAARPEGEARPRAAVHGVSGTGPEARTA